MSAGVCLALINLVPLVKVNPINQVIYFTVLFIKTVIAPNEGRGTENVSERWRGLERKYWHKKGWKGYNRKNF